MKNLASLVIDIWQIFRAGAQRREKSVIGCAVLLAVSLALIIVGLMKQ